MALLDLGVFFEVIVPLTGVEYTVMIGISTVVSGINFMNEIIALKDETGKPFFNVVKLTLICPDCKLTLPPGSSLTACVHNIHLLPEWKSQRRQDRIYQMMAGHSQLFVQEIIGEPTAKEVPVFSTESIDNLEQRPLYKTSEAFQAEHAFIAVDQTGGSANFAIVSGFFGPDNNLVVSKQEGRGGS